MSEIQIVAPQSLTESEHLATSLAKSQLLPDALRGKAHDILATILAGAELGLAPMQAIRGIVVIKGKPTLSADTMGALVKRRGELCEYLVLKESTPTRATYETKRRGDPSPTTMSFTLEDSQRAGLGGDAWKKYPAAMLRARCLSAICRAAYPDLVLGVYDPDELGEPTTVERDITPPSNGTRAAAVKELVARHTVDAVATRAEPSTTPPDDIAATALRARAGRLWSVAKAGGASAETFRVWCQELLGHSRPSTTWTPGDLALLELAQKDTATAPKRNGKPPSRIIDVPVGMSEEEASAQMQEPPPDVELQGHREPGQD